VPLEPETPDLSSSPVIGALAADAVAAQATETAGHGQPVHTHCENCGTALAGPFCHRCGQHDIDFHRSFGHLFLDALENFFHFDAKLFRNIITLLFLPGRLTADFNAGKRAAQMPPLRLYVFVSILFFFLVFVGTRPDAALVFDSPESNQAGLGVKQGGAPVPVHDALAEIQRDLAKDPATKDIFLANPPTPPPAAGQAPAARVVVNGSTFARWLEAQARRALEPDHQHELIASFLHSLPKMFLMCLPFFALYTRFLFRKSGQAYLPHLILALHFHTFIYLWVLCRNGWGFLAGFAGPGLAGVVLFGCNLWLVLYPFLMLRRLFANSWLRTGFKAGVLAAAYICTLACTFVLTAFVLFALV
jgi:hypothetical protein